MSQANYKDIINRILGLKNIKRKSKIEYPPHFPKPYPWRSYAMGRNKYSCQEVSGWRNNYHRSENHTNDGINYIIDYEENETSTGGSTASDVL